MAPVMMICNYLEQSHTNRRRKVNLSVGGLFDLPPKDELCPLPIIIQPADWTQNKRVDRTIKPIVFMRFAFFYLSSFVCTPTSRLHFGGGVNSKRGYSLRCAYPRQWALSDTNSVPLISTGCKIATHSTAILYRKGNTARSPTPQRQFETWETPRRTILPA